MPFGYTMSCNLVYADKVCVACCQELSPLDLFALPNSLAN